MKSIIQSEKECWLCGTAQNLECHHIFGGTANRNLSEKYGLKVWLCVKHHHGNNSPHMDREFDLMLKRIAEKTWINTYGTEDDFRKVFGKSWL